LRYLPIFFNKNSYFGVKMVYYDPRTGSYRPGLPLPEKDESNPNEAFKHKKWLEELRSDSKEVGIDVGLHVASKKYVDDTDIVEEDTATTKVRKGDALARGATGWKSKGWGRIGED
jgi:hypothetical protein